MQGGKQPNGTTKSRGQAVQANQCDLNLKIEDNIIINEKGKNHAEDHINLYKTIGESVIRRNRIFGSGDTNSGAGILLGDNGGENQEAYDNILVNCNQVGIGIAGGSEMAAYDNILYNDNYDGMANVGIYAYPVRNSRPTKVDISDNQIFWRSNKTKSNNPVWTKNCEDIVVRDNTLLRVFPLTAHWFDELEDIRRACLSPEIEPASIDEIQIKDDIIDNDDSSIGIVVYDLLDDICGVIQVARDKLAAIIHN